MGRISKILLCTAVLAATACSPATLGCRGTAVTSVIRFSGGPAPYRIATAEVYEGGCIRYAAIRTTRCVCEKPETLASLLDPQQVTEVIGDIEIVPTTLVDSEGVAVRHRNRAAERANRDLPPRARRWLIALDDALRPLIGAAYAPFLEER